MADERVNLKVDIDVTGDNQLGAAAAKLTAFEAVSKRLEARTNRLSGAMGKFNVHMTQGKRGAIQFTKQLTLLERVSAKFVKSARLMLYSVIALGIEFGVSALSLASVNGLFAVGKFAMQAYNYGMQALAGTVAALGVATIAAAAAFKEFQAAQFQYRYKDSKEVGSALDQSAAGLRSLYRDASLATFGVQALAGAFAAVNKNAAFTPASKAALKGLSDFVQASGDPANSLQAAGTMIGILQKEKKFTAEAINAAKSISPEFDKAFKKGNYKSVQAFLDDLKSGKLATDAGVLGQSDAVGRTLFAQFKSYLSSALVEISDVGTRVLEPVKEAVHDIFKGLTRSFRRVSGDLVTFGRGPFLKAMVAFTQRLEDFTIVLFRKFLPATEGFWKRTSNVFKQFAVYFREVKDALDPLREGGSIVIDTFGKPILEVFKQIGEGVKALADQAVKNKDNFLAFGDALKSVVQGFFEISRALREVFSRALPTINAITRGFGTFLKTIATLISALSAVGGPGGSAAMIGGLGLLAFKGRRSARFKRSRVGTGATRQLSLEEAIYSGVPFAKMGGGIGADDGMGPLSGKMAAAISGAMNPVANNLNSAAGALSGAASALSGAAAGAIGSAFRGGMSGGHVDRETGKFIYLPRRKPGVSNAEWDRDANRFVTRNRGEPRLALYQQGYQTPTLYSGGGGRPNIYGREIGVSQDLDAMAMRMMTKEQYRASERRAKLAANQNIPQGPHSSMLSSLPYRQQTDEKLRLSGMMPGFKAFSSGGSGTKQNMARILTSAVFGKAGLDLGNRGVVKNVQGFLGLRDGVGSGNNMLTRLATSEKGGNFGRGYRMAYANFLEAQKNDPTLKFNRLKALRSAGKYSFSGAGLATAIGGSYLANSKYVSDDARSAVQTGSGLMMLNPALGIGVGGAMMAANAKTKTGGALSGAASGAAIGGMMFGPGGALAGAAAGFVAGALRASSNQAKMVETAMKNIGEAQVSAVARGALAGGMQGSTTRARQLLAASGNLSKDFAAINKRESENLKTNRTSRPSAIRGAATAERRKLLQPYIEAGILDGNALSLATGDKSKDAEKTLQKTFKTMDQALTPAFDQFDEIMKSLKMSTGMTSEAIFELAMEKNVNLYDTTLKLSDAVQKLGVGMAKTATQFRHALLDIQVASLDVFTKFKQSKEMKDALQAAGETLRGGDTSPEAFFDYYTKLQDFQNVTNPNQLLTNFIVQSQRFGTGTNVGKGSMFAPGGVLSGVNISPEAAELINQSQKQTAAGSAFELTKQIGAMITGAGFRFDNADAGFTGTKNQITKLISAAQGGDRSALDKITALENTLAQGTAFQGKSASEVSSILSSILGVSGVGTGRGAKGFVQNTGFGTTVVSELSAQLDPFKDILTEEAKVMRESMQKGFFEALKTGFFDTQGTPRWWNQEPDWWARGYNAELDKDGKLLRLIAAGDTATARANQIGDTSTAKNLKRTMGRHSSFDKMLPGKRTVTSSLRNFNLGSPSSDHATGNAYDLVGQNLGSYSSLIKAAGGFSEFHGSGGSRHLHVVPPPGPMGDTSMSMLSKISGGDGNNASSNNNTFNITVNESSDAQTTAKAVAQEIIKMQRNWNSRV